MKTRAIELLAACLLLNLALPVFGQGAQGAAQFYHLGRVPGSDSNYSLASGVSDDGKVVGETRDGVSFYWVPRSGVIQVNSNFFAWNISADGNWITGAFYGYPLPFSRRPIRIPFGASSVAETDVLSSSGFGTALSADGRFVVGQSPDYGTPFRWDATTGIGFSLGGCGGWPTGISADGSVVVGGFNCGGAFRWTQQSGMVFLRDLIGGTNGPLLSDSVGISPDGSTIVGGYVVSTNRAVAFKWTQAAGMMLLGELPGQSFAGAVDATFDGGTIVGSATTVNGSEVFLYTTSAGMQRLKDVLVAQYGLGSVLNGWQLMYAVAISSDGRYIVGDATNPQGDTEAWLVDLKRPSNRPPLADASATQPLYISPNGTNAMVILDGSRSSDPDGDLLDYTWYEAGLTNALASGVVAHAILPVGTHEILLVVNDGLVSNTNAVTVEVITIAQAVERLIATINSQVARPQPLQATPKAAFDSIGRGNAISAANQLLAFQKQVRSQVAPFDPALAESLTQTAQDVIDSLGAGGESSTLTNSRWLASGSRRQDTQRKP